MNDSSWSRSLHLDCDFQQILISNALLVVVGCGLLQGRIYLIYLAKL